MVFIDTASLRTPPANATQQACPPRGQLRIIAAVVNSVLIMVKNCVVIRLLNNIKIPLMHVHKPHSSKPCAREHRPTDQHEPRSPPPRKRVHIQWCMDTNDNISAKTEPFSGEPAITLTSFFVSTLLLHQIYPYKNRPFPFIFAISVQKPLYTAAFVCLCNLDFRLIVDSPDSRN